MSTFPGRNSSGRGLKELVEYVARSLVRDPTQVRVSEVISGPNVHLELMVSAEDRGRVIGQRGRIANAIRALLRAAAAREGRRVTFDIV
ncbi:MAG: KH domain-containing protein [Anaerolineales bacterium]|jgi:predicted RNA-binding protein YlqC (UPF0109 family)